MRHHITENSSKNSESYSLFYIFFQYILLSHIQPKILKYLLNEDDGKRQKEVFKKNR